MSWTPEVIVFTIRRATIDDLEEIVRLRIAFLTEMESDACETAAAAAAAIREYTKEKLPTGEFLIWFAEHDGTIIGTSGLVYYRRPPTLHYHGDLHGYIMNMYTLPERRGQGVASALLQTAIDHVKTTSAKRIVLHATEMGRPIYTRFGFTATDTEMMLKLDP